MAGAGESPGLGYLPVKIMTAQAPSRAMCAVIPLPVGDSLEKANAVKSLPIF